MDLNRRTFGTLSLGACLAVLSGCGTPAFLSTVRGTAALINPPRPVPELGAATSDFAGKLLRELGTQDNQVCSPLSIMMALAMTRNGAEGETAAELDRTFEWGWIDLLNAAMAWCRWALPALSGEVQIGDREGEIELSIANQLFGQPDIDWSEEFLDALSAWYDSDIAEIDFTHAEHAADVINDWIAEQTRHKITELLQPGDLAADTVLALVNAIYLKAPWASAFDESEPLSFGNGGTPVPMMSQRGQMTGHEGDNYQLVSIPYLGSSLAMSVALPTEGAEEAMLQSFADGELARALDAAAPIAVDLTMPSWTTRSQLDLGDLLRRLGLNRAFEPERAEFGLMTASHRDLYLSKVVHGGFIAVDTEGTEAAAVTVVVAGVTSAPDVADVVTIVLDRPFAWVIHDVESNTALLSGWVADPLTE